MKEKSRSLAGIGGALVPGAWMVGGTTRLLERAGPGVLYKDLAACNAYGDGLAAAAKVRAPATLVLARLRKPGPGRTPRRTPTCRRRSSPPRPSRRRRPRSRAASPGALVIVLISHLDARQQAALSSGADSFISKRETPEQVVERLQAAAAAINPE